jgi:hypothetical protein
MGTFASGILGAVMGGGQAAATLAFQEQKDEMDKLREARLSALRTQEYQSNAAYAQGLKVADEKRQQGETSDFYKNTALPSTPTTTSTYTASDDNAQGPDAGGVTTETTPAAPTRKQQADYRLEQARETGNKDLIAQTYVESKDIRAEDEQKRKDDLEQNKVDIDKMHSTYYQAAADKLNAEAEAIRSGAKNKPQVPTIKIVQGKDDMGQPTSTYLVDEHTGATGVIVPGKPAVEAKTYNWYDLGKKDVPGKPAEPMHVEWSTSDGRMLPGGLADLYRGATTAAPGIINGARGQPGTAPVTASTSEPTLGAPSASRYYQGDKPPASYPNARLAPDGFWYVYGPNGYGRVLR